MFRMLRRGVLLGAALTFTAATTSVTAAAQTMTTGAINGVVTDSTGAALPGATVTLVQDGTGQIKTVKSDAAGRYSSDLMKPGKYTVSAESQNFTSDKTEVFVALSQTIEVDVKLIPAGTTATVEVNAESVPLIDQDNVSLITTLTQSQIQNLPAPGGDVTTVAFTAPGVVVNNGGSYGNFSSFGLPGVSNLFVLNGFDNQDPFLNLNNSGSSNLTLGAGELSEVSIVQNGYSSQYGRAAGAIINYTTKSGTNHFHGLADYYNNTSVMNANGWFNNYDGNPRPHAVSNQWAANIGGPIWKDKAFFFADYEGLRYVLPGASGIVNFPTPQLQSYVLGNVPAGAVALYTQAFNVYKNAPAYANAVPVTGTTGVNGDPNGLLGCGALAGTATGTNGGVFGVNVPCIQSAPGQANNINKEWLFTVRGDYKVSPRQDIYARYKVDHGSQPTSTSFISPLFNAVSIQPEDEGQLNDNFRITPNSVNSFTIAANWYSAYFGPASNTASAAAFPYYFTADAGVDGSGTTTAGGLATIGVPYYLTQGRDVTQYQVEDDFNYVRGKNTLKFGFNFRRDDVTDYDSEIETIFPYAQFYDLADFASGVIDPNSTSCFPGAKVGNCYEANLFQQSFSSLQHAHLALYNIGIYAQDELQATSKLRLTLGARIDRTGNPLCNDACFSQYRGSFPSSKASLTSPYSSAFGGPIAPSNGNAYPNVQPINFQPRFGFNYSLKPHTEIRGGIGWFSDLYPAGFLDGAIENFPNYNTVTVPAGVLGTSGANTAQGNAAAANAAILSGFKSGASVSGISDALTAQGIPFSTPSLGAYFPGEFKSPEFVEFSLQVQQQLGRQDAIILTYAGNYGFNEVLTNPFVNAAVGVFQQSSDSYASNGAIGNLPVTPPDPGFARVTGYTNSASSNYSGGVITYKHTGHGITGQINYTYSHGLDYCSNGCIGEPFNGNTSLAGQLTPNLSTQNLNYGSSDYDVRNNLAGDFLYDEPKFFHSFVADTLADGWVFGLKTYYRTGTPFSITNSGVGGYTNLGGTFIADSLVAHPSNACVSNPRLGLPGETTSCLNVAEYNTGGQSDFGNIARNSFRSPHFADSDVSLQKTLVNLEKMKFYLGANAYNIFNHANFAAPGSSLGTSTFGVITSTLAPPTSPYGSFQGNAVTQRIIQIHGKFTF